MDVSGGQGFDGVVDPLSGLAAELAMLATAPKARRHSGPHQTALATGLMIGWHLTVSGYGTQPVPARRRSSADAALADHALAARLHCSFQTRCLEVTDAWAAQASS